MTAHRKDITGERFGRLVAMRLTGERNSSKELFWECLCDCGKKKVASGTNLRRGRLHSCGCIRSFVRQTHGQSETKAYKSWIEMRRRCDSPERVTAQIYHDRGISYCDRWRSFGNFLSDMGERPDGTTLDRINNNAGYFPENCRWATLQQQANNKRCTTFIDGKSIADWARETGIKRTTIRERLNRGWNPNQAITKRVLK